MKQALAAGVQRLGLLAVLAALIPSSMAATRVALMNAICEDNSYRSTVAAMDFTAALQAEIAPGTQALEWVERESLALAENEFQLTRLGLVDRFESVRSGLWAKADWMVLTRISTNAMDRRNLSLEIVGLDRAESLCKTSFQIHAGAGPLTFGTETISRTAVALGQMLDAARHEAADQLPKTKVAVLFITPSGRIGEYPGLREAFADALTASAPGGNRLHVIRFEHAGEAIDEANLVLSGLAQVNPDAWQLVADHYVWGQCNVEKRRTFDRASRTWNDQRYCTATLSVWDGRHDLKSATVQVTNAATSEALGGELARAVRPRILEHGTTEPAALVRQRISESLVAQAIALTSACPAPWLAAAEGKAAWLEIVQILETACFFDPGNATARELWVRVRWGRMASFASQNEFFFARRRSQAWQKHVTQFGFKSACPVPRHNWWETNSIAAEYVLSAWRPVEMFNFSQDDQARWGVPRDAGGPEIWEWRRQFASDLFARWETAPEDSLVSARSWDLVYAALSTVGGEFVVRDAAQRQRVLDRLWPRLVEGARNRRARFDEAYLRNVSLHFAALGRPGGERALLAQLDEANTAQAAREASGPIILPTIDQLNSER